MIKLILLTLLFPAMGFAATSTDLGSGISQSEKGAANGVATLDSTGKVPVAQIPSGGGGSTAWGTITGTLSSQTDLQTALNGKQTAFAGTTSQYVRGDGSLATLNTANVPELTNLYFTNARAQGAVSATAPIVDTGGVFSCVTATGSVAGCLAAADFATFAAKEPAISSGTTSQYWRGDKSFQTLDTSVVPENGNLYFTNARAIAAPITGYTSGAGTVSGTDSILQAIQKLNGNTAALSSSAITSLTTDVVATGPGAAVATIQPAAVTLAKMANVAAHSYIGNNTGSGATPLALTNTQVTADLIPFVGDSGSGGTQGLVPAPAAYSSESGNYLSAGGSFSYVDQSKTINPAFSLISQTAATPSGVKFETTSIFTSTTTGKKYAIGVGFVYNPLTIWDISDQTSPVLVGTIVEAGGGAYNVTVGVVSGVQYAFVGYNSGSKLAVFNLTNPAVPTLTGTTVITGSPGSIYGVSFLNGYVYCATQNAGLTVMDVGGGTGSPSAPVQTYQQGSAKSFGVVAVGTNVYTTQYSTSNPYTVRQLVSWTLTSAGSPSVPSQLQSLQVTAAGEALGLSLSGNTAFVTTAASGAYNINLVDITTPSSMTNLSQINSANAFGSGFYAVGSGNYVYVPSGGNATYGGAIDVYDISTRSSPIHIAQVTSGNVSSAFGGLALSGGYIFVADYGTSAGANPYFDVFTAMNEKTVIGAATVNNLTVTGTLTATVSIPATTATVTTNTTIPTLTKNYIIDVNTTSGALAITLPDAVASVGYCVKGKNIGSPANNVTYGTTSAQTIDGNSTYVQTTLNDANDFCAINGNWSIF